MKKEMYKMLTAALMLTISGGVVGSAADTTLDTVYVNADRDKAEDTVGTLPGGFIKEEPSVGLLGHQDVMDAPFAVSEVSQKTIKAFASPVNGVNEALALNPSVTIQSGSLYQDIAIRGFRTNGHRQYVNGIPGLLCQENIPYYWVDSVSVVSGPNIGVRGTGLSEAIGGVVDYTSKKAVTNATDLKLAYRGGSSFEEGVDYQTRLGSDKKWGVRVTTNNIHGDTAIDNEKLEQQNIFVNIDHIAERSKTNFLFGYNHTKHYGGPYGVSFDFKTVTDLPSAPKGSNGLKPDWSYNAYENYIMAFNHEQKLSEHVTGFVNAGYHKENWYGYIDGSPKVFNNNGDYRISMSNFPLFLVKTYLGMGIKGDFNIGKVKNEYMIGVDKSWETYDIDNGNPSYSWSGHGNIYQTNSWANPGDAHWIPLHSDTTQMEGWHVVDTLKALDDKLQVTLGVHGHRATVNQVGATSLKKSDAITPTYAISYKFTPDFMMYADHTESFGMGARVSTTSALDYVNKGKMLDPAKTKQNEVGFKVKTGKFLNTLAYFDIKQANAIDVKLANGRWLRALDGEQENKGFEWAFTGNINDRWDLIGGAMYIDVKQTKTKNGANDGKPVDGIPHWTANVGAIYHPNSQWSIIGRGNYIGTAKINGNTIKVPSSFVFDLGATYDTTFGKTPVTLQAMLYNVAGKDYWIPSGSSSSLTVGGPRTFVFSANFRF